MESKKSIERIHKILNCALVRIQNNLQVFNPEFPISGYPQYKMTKNDNWETGFWPGMLWLAYSEIEDPELCAQAQFYLASFAHRLEKRIDISHDLGFLYTLSAKAEWMMTGNENARQLAINAAKELSKRYNPNGNYIQAWDNIGAAPEAGRMIIDCMLNLPLLYWASQQTGDSSYQEIACKHAISTKRFIVRKDFSTYHTFFFNPDTGEPLFGKTHQGYSDESLWSRGQAWALYGFALSAEWLNDPEFLWISQGVAHRFLFESPATQVPIWDFRLPKKEPQLYDSSAGAIAACGLIRLARLTGYEGYREQAITLLNTLIENCWETDPTKQGLLRHGALHIPGQDVPDGYLIFGDYYFLEALLSVTDQAPDFWGPTK